MEQESGLRSKAILVNVNIGTWSGRKYDNTATKTVVDAFDTDNDCGRFNKLLVDHKPILQLFRIGSRARQFHYEHTLPWSDVGSRLLPTRAYTQYIEGINNHMNDFWTAVETFVRIYPTLVEARRLSLKELWREEDYPDPQHIRNKFTFSFKKSFLPDPNTDIRLDLSEVEVEKVRESLIQSMKEVEDRAVRDLWIRMQKVVARIVDRLDDPDKIFKNSTFENIGELEKVVGLLNVTDDHSLSDTMGRIKDELTAYDPKRIREDDDVRKEVHGKAKDILDKISAFV